MATLPDAESIGIQAPRPSAEPLNYPRQIGRPEDVGRALSEAGAKIGSAMQRNQDASDQFDYAQARSNYLVGKSNLLGQIQDDPNWQTADQTYQDGMQKLQAGVASSIKNPRLQDRFAMESGTDYASGLSAIQHFQRQKGVDDGRATLGTNLDAMSTAALTDPSSSQSAIQNMTMLIDGATKPRMVGSLQIPPSISADEAVKMKKAAVQDYARKYATMQIEQNPLRAADLLGKGIITSGAQSQDIYSAISSQESGSNPNSPTSVDGAVGQMQITPSTFAQYAKPGEDIHNPADNVTVGHRIIDDLSAKYNGDPSRVAVGYFSGPGNVAPPGSSTPYITDKKDGSGKSTSAYVSDVMGRLGGGAEQNANGDTVVAPQKTGTPIDFLDPAERADLHHVALARADSESSAANIAQRKNAEVAANKIVSQLIADPTKVDPMTIANDPNIKAEQKWQLFNMTKAALADQQGPDTTKTLGPGFWNVYKAVTAPPGTPGRITDPNQLFPMAGPGGQLSLSGVSELSKLIAGKGTPDGEAEAQMQKQFFANAKGQITGSDDGLHLKDPKGDELFLKFQAHAFADIAAKKAQGLTPAQIYSPDSPTYVGKSISTFKRPMAQWTADMMNDVGGVSPPAAGDLKSLPDIVGAVQSGKMTRQAGIALARQRGLLADDAPPVPSAH